MHKRSLRMCFLPGRCRSEGTCWRDSQGAASGACLQACLLHESPHHTSHTAQPHQHSRSPLLVPSHKHHTESSFSYSCLISFLSCFNGSSDRMNWGKERIKGQLLSRAHNSDPLHLPAIVRTRTCGCG